MEGRVVALATGEYIEESDPKIVPAVCEAAKVFESMGARIEEVELPWLRGAALANGLMTTADGAAYHRERLKEHADWFGTDVRQRLETGAAYTSTEYALARRTQTEARRACELFFESHDLLLLPTTPIPATLIEGEDAIERARQLTRFSAPFNLTGLPALSLPCGFTQSGLPIGLQIVSRAWNEAGILQAGYAYEKTTDWHKRKPNLSV
jgi:aspartyl-tRNA(Asn)/glutamyl-tRNA(Gln) amidotransferase subunit A